MKILKNTWYGICHSDRLTSGALLARKIYRDSIVLYRDSSGAPVALRNRCPRRYAQLSLGCLKGDEVQCAYHGLQFDRHGRCSVNPHGDGVPPKAATVQVFQLLNATALCGSGLANRKRPTRNPSPTCPSWITTQRPARSAVLWTARSTIS